jgi:hypothetical protein
LASIAALLGREHRDGIEQDRRSAVDLLLGRDLGAVVERDPADLRRDHLPDRAFGFQRLGQRIEQLGARPIGQQQAHLSPGEIRRAVGDDRERRRCRQV